MPVCLGVALLWLGGLSGPAGAASGSASVKVFLPAPGHITLESVSLTVKHPSLRLRTAGALRPKFPGAASLPPSIRILYLRRVTRTRTSLKAVVMLLVLNRAQTGATHASAALEPDAAPGGARAHASLALGGRLDLDLALAASKEFPTSEAESKHGDDYALHQFYVRYEAEQNADRLPRSDLARVEGILNDLFTGHSGHPPTPDYLGMTLSDPNLETGHYDDGHAFGWTKNKSKDVWVTLSTSAYEDQWNAVVDELETPMGTDLNNDGVVGPLASGGGTGSGGPPSCAADGPRCAPGGTSCSGTGSTASQTLEEPATSSTTYNNYDFTTEVPASCNVKANATADLAVYVVSDADGSILACAQDGRYIQPPPGEPACPMQSSEYSTGLPGDSRSSVVFGDPAVPSGASVWHIPVSVAHGSGTGTPTSAHIVYRWQIS